MSDDTTTTDAPVESVPTPDPSAPEIPKFKCGFAILISEDGGVFIEKDLSIFSVPVERESTLIEIRRYASEILMDLQAQAAAEYTSLRIQADSQGPSA